MFTLFKKALLDIKHRKSQAFFTVISIVIAVSSMGILGVMPLLNRAMVREINSTSMNNLFFMADFIDNADDMVVYLENFDGVEGVSYSHLYFTRMSYLGETVDITIWGIDSFSQRDVDKLHVFSGSPPGYGEALFDRLLYGPFDKSMDSLSIDGSSGTAFNINITGTAGNTVYFRNSNKNSAVFYVNTETFVSLSNSSGVTCFSLSLKNDKSISYSELSEISKEITAYMLMHPDSPQILSLPQIRAYGDWHGKGDILRSIEIFYVLIIVAVLSSLFFMSNTINTIIKGQKEIIKTMKSIGATDKQIVLSYFATSGLIRTIGSATGMFMGIFLTANVLYYIGDILGLKVKFMLHLPTIFFSLFIGVTVTFIGSNPALKKSREITVSEPKILSGELWPEPGLLKKVKMCNFPLKLLIPLRNIVLRKKSSLVIMLEIAFVTAVILAIVSINHSMESAIVSKHEQVGYDIMGESIYGAEIITPDIISQVSQLQGIMAVEPVFSTKVDINGARFECRAIYSNDTSVIISEGSHFGDFSDNLSYTRNYVMVSRKMSEDYGYLQGDSLNISFVSGTYLFEITGTDDGVYSMEKVIYISVEKMSEITGNRTGYRGFKVWTDGDNTNEEIFLLVDNIQNFLDGKGIYVNVYSTFDMGAGGIEYNRVQSELSSLLLFIAVLTLLLGWTGLLYIVSMNFIERYSETATLLLAGLKKRSIGVIYGTELFMLSIPGYIFGLFLGYFLGRTFSNILLELMGINFEFVYSIEYALWALLAASFLVICIIVVCVIRYVGIGRKQKDISNY